MSFFEGPEKKAEIVVSSSAGSLRSLGDDAWRRVVERSRATVLSKISNDSLDAYLLSESSLFVWDSSLVMITCGRTRLVDGIEEILSLVPRDAIELLVYERKNEHFPEHQSTTFMDDARRLADMFEGRAVRFGDEDDHWVNIFHTTKAFRPERDDVTLEILMHGISPQVQEFFSKGGVRPSSSEGEKASRESVAKQVGLDSILEGFTLDEFVFEPRGYSLNGVCGSKYATVHVTPESIGSYVSFETNLDFRNDPGALISSVIELFLPRSFDLVAFMPEGSIEFQMPGYTQKKRVRDRFSCGYDVTYRHSFQSQQDDEGGPFEFDLS